jgi:hypothetical protein
VPTGPKPQAQLVFELAEGRADQAFSNSRSGLEKASQAEYAGSIPVIGSTLTRANAVQHWPRRTFGPVSVPYGSAGNFRLPRWRAAGQASGEGAEGRQ